MASTISVLGEPERVNLVVRALKPDYLLLDIFLHLRSETWTQWTIEAARVKVHHRPCSVSDVVRGLQKRSISISAASMMTRVSGYRFLKAAGMFF